MSEQKRIDEQLDQLVAERTSELAEANDALKKELAVERQRTEAAQRTLLTDIDERNARRTRSGTVRPACGPSSRRRLSASM